MTEGSKSPRLSMGNVEVGIVTRVPNIDDACWELCRYPQTVLEAAMIEVASPYPGLNQWHSRFKRRRIRVGEPVDWYRLPWCLYLLTISDQHCGKDGVVERIL